MAKTFIPNQFNKESFRQSVTTAIIKKYGIQ